MNTRNLLRLLAACTAAAAIVSSGTAIAGNPDKKEARAEMKFGFQAAKRGYWQEALMRFERANELTPDQPRVLNNIAVAQEATGRFEQALLTYQTALTIDPGNQALNRNYARFQEFYSAYLAPEEAAGSDDTGEGADDAAKDD